MAKSPNNYIYRTAAFGAQLWLWICTVMLGGCMGGRRTQDSESWEVVREIANGPRAKYKWPSRTNHDLQSRCPKNYVSFSESISPSNTNCKDTKLLQYCQKAFLSPLGYLFHLTYAKSNQTQDKSSSNFRNFHQIRAKYIRGIAKLNMSADQCSPAKFSVFH